YEEIDVTAEFSYNPDGRFYMMMHAYGENEDGEEVLFVKVNEGVYITDGHVLKTIVYRELEMSDGEIYYETSAIEPETMNFLIIDDNLILADGEMYFAKTEPSGIWIFG
ncbi:MAG: hypothetical protein FWH20_08925, partial [Oscillospiraceae bacterium]|nr:hypothetical protein [Oscillospiraceae bacterium]